MTASLGSASGASVTLLVDCGNTRLKWAEHARGVWRTGARALPSDGLERWLDGAWSGLARPARVVLCCVGGRARAAALQRWVEATWHLAADAFVAAPRTLDVANRYRDPASLGADRWAALVGARAVTRAPVCIVDCGTAVTIDALTANGEFIGGVIFPGLRLLRASLARGTDAVQPPPGGDASCLGRSTADAVAGGTLFGLAGAIERVVHEQESAFESAATVLLTGGDAESVAPHLTRPVELVPDLVLRGLARYAGAL